MKRTFKQVRNCASLAIFLIFVISLAGCSRPAPLLYCGAGLRGPAAEMVDVFAEKHDVKIECDYAGSEILLSRLKLSNRGDLYLPGDVHYVDLADEEGFITDRATLCYFVPVIITPKGNPKNILTLEDLTKEGVRLGLGNPETCAVGRKAKKLLEKNKISPEAIKKNLVFQSVTAPELVTTTALGTVDAAIIWDASAQTMSNRVDIIPIPVDQNVISTVVVGSLTFSEHPELTEKFLEFARSPEATEIFKKHHYTTEKPE